MTIDKCLGNGRVTLVVKKSVATRNHCSNTAESYTEKKYYQQRGIRRDEKMRGVEPCLFSAAGSKPEKDAACPSTYFTQNGRNITESYQENSCTRSGEERRGEERFR